MAILLKMLPVEYKEINSLSSYDCNCHTATSRPYQRLVNTAIATGRSLEAVMLHALKVGSPPDWENAPDGFKADLAALDRLEDEALWKVATAHKTEEAMARHFELLELNK